VVDLFELKKKLPAAKKPENLHNLLSGQFFTLA